MRNICEQLSVSDSGMLGGECQPIICYSWASEGKLSHAFINDIHHTDQRGRGWGRGYLPLSSLVGRVGRSSDCDEQLSRSSEDSVSIQKQHHTLLYTGSQYPFIVTSRHANHQLGGFYWVWTTQ